MFCIYLRTNSDLCHLQHKLIGFYNRDEKCLHRGTDWVFNKAVCASSGQGYVYNILGYSIIYNAFILNHRHLFSVPFPNYTLKFLRTNSFLLPLKPHFCIVHLVFPFTFNFYAKLLCSVTLLTLHRSKIIFP